MLDNVPIYTIILIFRVLLDHLAIDNSPPQRVTRWHRPCVCYPSIIAKMTPVEVGHWRTRGGPIMAAAFSMITWVFFSPEGIQMEFTAMVHTTCTQETNIKYRTNKWAQKRKQMSKEGERLSSECKVWKTRREI